MPEGHSIKRLALTFDEWFVGTRCSASSPQGRFLKGAALLDGRVMTEARSIGKHLFLRFDPQEQIEDLEDGLWLHVHLGLYGAWRFHSAEQLDVASFIGAPRRVAVTPSPPSTREHTGFGASEAMPGENEGLKLAAPDVLLDDKEWSAPPPVGAVRLRIENSNVAADLAGPTRCEVLTTEEVQLVADRLGPDPLDDQSDPQALRNEFVARVRASRRPVGELVMDQSIAAGVGNIYRAEGLFRQGISPMRRGNNVSADRLLGLWDQFVEMLHDGVQQGRITTVRPEDRPERDEDNPEDIEAQRWYVYHRAGRECLVCGRETIQEKQMQGRRLFWCSTCQR